jgi:POT family proton-dependent oligopeptide transporter
MNLLDQPRGLGTLFFTEMWERFTYYGMRAVLILFMVATIDNGGLGLNDRDASSIYGLYIAGTYVFALLGGWIADHLVGAQRAVIGGGVLILFGNSLIALDSAHHLFAGLLVISCGVGLLKPNISALVAQLYPEGGSRRDAGFSLFYVGINLGAFLGSLLVPLCVVRFGWRWGFALPSAGMLLGLLGFLMTRHRLGSIGHPPTKVPSSRKQKRTVLVGTLAVILLAILFTGYVRVDAQSLSRLASWAIGCLAVAYFLFLLGFAGLGAEGRGRVYVMMALFAGYALFMAGFEQAGASLNLFADRYTNRELFGWEVPAGVFQAATALFVIVFAPMFAALWLLLGRHERDLVPLTKFAVGLGLLGAGFFVMYVASGHVMGGQKISPAWLLLTYLIHEWGDLCISPVGLSSMSRLVPKRLVGQALGLWFLAIALGNNLAGQLSSAYDLNRAQSMRGLFLSIVVAASIGALLMWILASAFKRGSVIDDQREFAGTI